MVFKIFLAILTTFSITLGSISNVFSEEKSKIGILTSGGDCSGLNSIIYAVYKKASELGYEVIGFKQGVHGLVNNDYIILNKNICTPEILRKGGSILKSNTGPLKDKLGNPLSKEEGDKAIIQEYHKLNLKGLIYIGGDGSIGLMKNILQKDPSLNIIAIPKTIDNDISNTDVSVGFSTVTKVVDEDLSNIITTAQSHSRIMVVEVMGRDAGYIALISGIAAGADAIIIPERKYNINNLITKMKRNYNSGKDYGLIVVSEGVEFDEFKYESTKFSDVISRKSYGGVSEFIVKKLQKAGFDARAVILGHVQRGGTTSVEDRILAQKFGIKAVQLIDTPNCGYLLGILNNKISTTKLSDIKITTRNLNSDDSNIILARNLGIYIGE